MTLAITVGVRAYDVDAAALIHAEEFRGVGRIQYRFPEHELGSVPGAIQQ